MFDLGLIERELTSAIGTAAHEAARAELAEVRHAIDNALVMRATRNGVIRTQPFDFAPHQKVAILILPENDGV